MIQVSTDYCNVLQSFGWELRYLSAWAAFAHSSLPGHIIRVGEEFWSHDDQRGLLVGRGKGPDELRRHLAK